MILTCFSISMTDLTSPLCTICNDVSLFRYSFLLYTSARGAVPSGHAVAQMAASPIPARLPESLPVQTARLLPAGGSRNRNDCSIKY